MKNTSVFTIAVIGLMALVGAVRPETAHGTTNAAALRQAAGLYKGTFRGPKTMIRGSVKVPRGTGRGVIALTLPGSGGRVLKLPVRFSKAVVLPGGRKVSYRGRVSFPASVTQGFGSVSGTFVTTVTLATRPSMRGLARLKVGGASLNVRFSGRK